MDISKRLGSIVSSKQPANNEGVINPSVNGDARLETLGYEQELKRSFSLVGMIGFAFSIVTCWTALGGVLVVGITSGGPPVMVWSWLAISILTLCVAYSFAEFCSAYPVAGGQYSWVAILAPKSISRGMSYVTGWFMIVGLVAMCATNNFIAANWVLGMAVLNNPDYVIERWHTVLTTYLVAFVAAGSNLYLTRFFDKISSGFLIWNVVSFFVVIITLLATNKNKQSASFVFTEFQNDTGFSSGGMAVMIGLLQSFFGMCCYDAPTHMTEEMLNPSVEAPRAIVLSVYLGGFTGFIFLIVAFFCCSDLEAVATTPTLVPLIEIFRQSTNSIGAATFLTVLVAVIGFGAANGLMAEGSRSLYAFARDNGLPFSKVFSKVDKKSSVPVNAIILCTLGQIALNSIYFASYEGFSTVISISTFGFYLSYAMPLLARLLNVRATKHIEGTAYSLGSYGPWVNLAGLTLLLFAGVDFQFPQLGPVTADNMNYCSAASGVIALIAIVTWFAGARKKFTGPQIQVEGQRIAATIVKPKGEIQPEKAVDESDGSRRSGEKEI